MAQYRQEDFWNAMVGSFQQPGTYTTIGNLTSAGQQQAAPPAPAAPARPKPGDIGERGEWQGVEMDGLAKGDVLRRREDGELVNERTGKVDVRPWALDASPFVIPRDSPNKPKPGDIIHDPKMLEVGMVCVMVGYSVERRMVEREASGWRTKPDNVWLDMYIERLGVRIVSVPWEAEKPAPRRWTRPKMDCETCPTPHSFCGVEWPHGLCAFCNRCPTWIAKHAPPVGSKWVPQSSYKVAHHEWVVTEVCGHMVGNEYGGLAIEEFYRLYKRADDEPAKPRMPAVGERWKWKQPHDPGKSYFDVVSVPGENSGYIVANYGTVVLEEEASCVAEDAEYVGTTPAKPIELPTPAHDFGDPYCHTTADSPEARVPRCKVCGSVEAKGSVLWRAMCEPTKWREAGDRLVAEATSAIDYPTRAPRRRCEAPEPMRSGLGSIGCRMTGSRR